MSNKNTVESRKNIEEFLFLVEQSTNIITDVINEVKDIVNDKDSIEMNLRQLTEDYYLKYKAFFYYNVDTIFDDLIKFDLTLYIKPPTKCEKYSESDNEIFNFITEEYYGKGDFSREFNAKKFSLERRYISIKKDIPLLQHFQNREVIEGLRNLAEKSVVCLDDKREYVVRLINVVENLENKYTCIPEWSQKVEPEIKFWMEPIYVHSKKLLKSIIGKKGVIGSDRVRTFILNALIEAAGIKAVGENKEKFIAEILNADSTIVGQYFNDFKKERFGMVEKNKKSVESEKSKEDDDKIKGNMFSRQMIEAKNVSGLLLNQMKSKENDADVLKGNDTVEKMISIISSVEQVDLKEDKK